MFPNISAALQHDVRLFHSMATTLTSGIAVYHYSKQRLPKLRWLVLNEKADCLQWYDIEDGDRDTTTLQLRPTPFELSSNGVLLSDITAVTVGQPQVNELVYGHVSRDVQMDNFVSITTDSGVLEVECLSAEQTHLLVAVLHAVQHKPHQTTLTAGSATPVAWYDRLTVHAARQQPDPDLNSKAQVLYERLFASSVAEAAEQQLRGLQQQHRMLQERLTRLQHDQLNIANLAHKQMLLLYYQHKELVEVNLSLRMHKL